MRAKRLPLLTEQKPAIQKGLLRLCSQSKKAGHHAKVQGLDQYSLTDLSKEEYFLAIMSTHGDGEPPLAAQKFYDFVHQNEFKLSKLKYSVLALGDSVLIHCFAKPVKMLMNN